MAIYLRSEILSAVNEILNEMNVNSLMNSVLKNEKGQILLKTDIQTCLNHKFNNSLKTIIHKILMNYCFYAEKISPGGFRKTLMNISTLISGMENNTFKDYVFHPKLNDLKKLIEDSINEKSIANLVIEAIRLAGFGGKVSIEKSVNSSTSIELIEGYIFKHKLTDLKSIKLIKPNVICIDGYIESVSEVNMLFECFAGTKQQLLLISRGMHDDVINTIKVNRDRGMMFVYPIIIDFDLDGINTITDISIVAGTNPVSCHLGELISSLKDSNAVEIDEAVIIGNSLTLKNSKTRRNINIHVKNLIEKRRSSNVDIEDLITTRIKSLTNNNVVIRLCDDSNYVLKSQAIDHTLRSIKSMLDYGIIIQNEKLELNATVNSYNELSKKFVQQMLNLGSAIS